MYDPVSGRKKVNRKIENWPRGQSSRKNLQVATIKMF